MENSTVQAIAKYIPISAQKVRRVTRVVSGMTVLEALAYLEFMPQRAAKPVRKVIASAAANAEENLDIPRDDLFVAMIAADAGPTRKWRRFGARGRFKPIKRRSSHIRVVLKEIESAT
ncbi:MAG: 50S ribosomal protein L22 [Ardenticatenaceae bacterium]